MQVNKVAHSPSFGKMWYLGNKLSKEEEKIYSDISAKLNTIDPNFHPTKTPIDALEQNGYDVYISSGLVTDSVFVDIAKIVNPNSPNTDNSYRVGRYTSDYPFELSDLKQVKRNINAYKTMLIAIPMLVALGVMSKSHKMTNNLENIDKIKTEQVFKSVADSIDSLKKDTILLFKKIK